MNEPMGFSLEKISRLLADFIKSKEDISASKKALRDVLKETEDVEMKARLKELKDARKKLSLDVRDLQEQIERSALDKNPEIKDFREKVLEMEEKEADLRVSVREASAPLLEKKALIEIDLAQIADMPVKVHLMRGVVANINGKEQNL